MTDCGFILIDKEIGISSAKALYPIKKKLPKGCKIGHAGTLDPFASGLLIAGVGRATKAIEYVMGMDKVYEFTVKWGEATDTDDLTGQVINRSNIIPTLTEIKKVLCQFHGRIDQIPPLYSAIHIDGRRAYDMARNGEIFNLKARQVTVNRLEIINHNANKTSLIMECSKGCYVRSIARDIADKLGTYSHVIALRRTKIGNFNVEDASDKIIPTLEIFNHYPKVYIDNKIANKIINGVKIKVTDLEKFLLINEENNLVMIGINVDGESKLKRIS